jgi:hypothetical protein
MDEFGGRKQFDLTGPNCGKSGIKSQGDALFQASMHGKY